MAPDLLNCLYGDHSMSDLGVVRTDEGVLLHLSRIAAGLESPMIGETEVLSQFRQAVAGFNNGSTPGCDLARVLDSAVAIGRATRRLLGWVPAGSLASVAAKAAAASERVAILGGGAMARAAAQHLAGVDVSVFARRPVVIAGRPAHPWESVPDALATYPAVISTVPGWAPLVAERVIFQALDRRREPLLLIDLGMPPGFSPRETDPVRYLGVDDVASSVHSRPSAEAERVVAREADSVWSRLIAPKRAGPIINAMVDQAERAVEEEVRRFAKRLPGADDPEAVLRQLAHTVARRILHPPISYVGSRAGGTEALDVVAEAFGLHDE